VRIVPAHPIELILPAEPAPVRLMNPTWVDRDGVSDVLEDVADLRTLLAAVGWPVPAGPAWAELVAARGLRAALRTLAGAGSAADRSTALETVNAALAAAPAPDVLAAGPEGWTLTRVDGSSFRASVGRLAREGAQVLADRTRPLRTCTAPGCGLFYVQHHQRRRWCSTACGNRVRAARYYRRHRRGDAG